jgi:hypothetical protein
MSSTELYKFKKDGTATYFAETKNAFRGASAIWDIIEKRYLPKYIPSWATNAKDEYSRTSDYSNREAMNEIWGLFYSDNVSGTDIIVLGSTFDNVIVMKEDMQKVIIAFREFEGETSLKEQADLIEEAYNTDEDLIAIAWNQTSVNSDAWMSSELIVTDDDEYYLPYNMFKHEGHWNLFEIE